MFSDCNCSSELGLRQSCGTIGIYCASCRLYKLLTVAAAATVNTVYTNPALCNGVSTSPNTRKSRGSAMLELISTCAGVRYRSCDSSPKCGGSDRNRCCRHAVHKQHREKHNQCPNRKAAQIIGQNIPRQHLSGCIGIGAERHDELPRSINPMQPVE